MGTIRGAIAALVLGLGLVPLPLGAVTPPPVSLEASSGLEPYSGKARVLLLFAPQVASARLAQQLSNMSGLGEEVAQHRLIIAVVVGNAPVAIPPLYDAPAVTLNPFQLRQYYIIDPMYFRAVLIGTDLGIKMNSDIPLTGDRIFAVLDDLPMHNAEQRRSRVPLPGLDGSESIVQ